MKIINKFVLIHLVFLIFINVSFANDVNNTFFEDYPIPKAIELFGDKVPLNDIAIWERLDREFTILVWDRPQIFMWLKRAGRYFPYIEKQLSKAGLPEDLKYVAVAESSFHSHVRSSAGAVGMWQFMKHTGKRNGLMKRSGIDERRNFEKSTLAAIKYLKKLHGLFKNWNLAVASYNCGERRLKKEIKEQTTSDFYNLRLPNETERYIFRIMAIKIIMEDPKAYGYNLAKDRVYKPYKYETVKIKIKFPISIADVANSIGTNYQKIKLYNPHLTGREFPSGTYDINIPRGSKSKLHSAVNEKTSEFVKKIKYSPKYFYKVKNGDTLIGVSIKTGISVKTIRRLNNLNGSLIRIGQKLRLKP